MNIVIYGINGKMGQMLLATAKDYPAVKVVGGVDAAGGNAGDIPVYKTAAEIKSVPDAIIDFSRPSSLPDILSCALKNKVRLVLCTTGYSDTDELKIKEASLQIPIFKSANMSVGVNLIAALVETAARVLGDAFDIEIVEKHHNQKEDAPSGTALMLANAANSAFAQKKRYVYGRDGESHKRTTDEIGLHAVRGGNLAGDHDVLFIGQDETVSISHTAFSKRIFASGALKAALILKDKGAGLYSFKNV